MAAGDNWTYYAYRPRYDLAYMGIGLFAAAFVVQLFLALRRRTWYMIPFVIAMIGECLGYAFRRVSADHLRGRGAALTWYLLQELFLILSPALMCASYLCFGRIITYVGERWTPVSSKWVTFIFVTQDIVIIGLGIFAIFAGTYHTRARRAGVPAGPWSRCLFTLYAGSVCVLVRGIFRTIEFGTGSGGGQGYLLSREGYFYGLEFGPIIIAALIFCVSYPGYYIPHARSARLFPQDQVLDGQEGLEAGPSASGSEVEGEKLEAMEGGEKRRWWSRRA
ncbi:RTA-like protein [Rhodotorula toruloides]|uniref:RTA-like protein n=1 Tax=Rhodotorula toruloides TaxID=5286 RepID=A0A511KI31_RHOTO|nr:RTA-like protein [Rhodotorula toruloides]